MIILILSGNVTFVSVIANIIIIFATFLDYDVRKHLYILKQFFPHIYDKIIYTYILILIYFNKLVEINNINLLCLLVHIIPFHHLPKKFTLASKLYYIIYIHK